jgi:hypothetical protein
MVVGVLLGLGIIYFYRKRVNTRYYCNDCRHEWKTGGLE